jgi:hypothetical protein
VRVPVSLAPVLLSLARSCLALTCVLQSCLTLCRNTTSCVTLCCVLQSCVTLCCVLLCGFHLLGRLRASACVSGAWARQSGRREGGMEGEGGREGGRRRYAGIGAESNPQQRTAACSGRMHTRTDTNEHTNTQQIHTHTHTLTHTCDRMPQEAISDDADSKSGSVCIFQCIQSVFYCKN